MTTVETGAMPSSAASFATDEIVVELPMGAGDAAIERP
ncbi:hypothetical protein BH11ACT1_BH11ACT1_02460 [soil metagenome]